MERRADIKDAKAILKDNFIGISELEGISERLGIEVPNEVPEIPFTVKDLDSLNDEYFLILGSTKMINGDPLTISALRDKFGMHAKVQEPGFYNQDWYIKEDFVKQNLKAEWILIRKNIIDSTRSVDPDLILKDRSFPSAVQCTYAFFVSWFHSGYVMWEYDFVWCSDKDHNGDRIYIGKYRDIEGINNNGFSIHRHLALRNCYGSV